MHQQTERKKHQRQTNNDDDTSPAATNRRRKKQPPLHTKLQENYFEHGNFGFTIFTACFVRMYELIFFSVCSFSRYRVQLMWNKYGDES